MRVRPLVKSAVRTVAVVMASLCITGAPPAAGNGFDSNGQCVGDQDGNGHVTIDEILTAVSNALGDCQFVPITLQFRGVVGDVPFACGNAYEGIGTTGGEIVPADFRFYIHDVRLVSTEGKEVPLRLDQDGIWQHDNLALLDFENKVPPCGGGTTLTNNVVHGMVAPGNYNGVRFFLGVPFNMNHQNQAIAPSPLNLSALFWSWQDGYKFVRIDTAFDNLRVHLGSTGCELGPSQVVTSCARPNVGEVHLDHFDPATNVIVADLAALLADSDIKTNQVNTAPGCQSDPDDLDCIPIFKNLGINFSDGSPNPSGQKFFRVE